MTFKLIYHKIKLKKWKKYTWKKIGTYNIGDNYHVIGANTIEIGNNFRAGNNLVLESWDKYKDQIFDSHITIGSNVSMMENCMLSSCNYIEIGDGCLFGANVFITDNLHGNSDLSQLSIPPIKRNLHVKQGVKVGSNVWLGRNVCIMPGVTIGDGAIIGANAVVTHDIPAFSVAVGVPAKVIKTIK